MRGLVSRLLEHSFVDGPGNRAVVFMQGCHLRCLYCHNPQTQAECDGCGACVPGCPGRALRLDGARLPGAAGRPLIWDPDLCQGCDQCIMVCQHRADPRARWYTVDDLAAWLTPIAPFVSGVTVTGGEPLLQSDFAGALCRRVQEMGLSTLIETSAALDFAALAPVLPWLDGALVDLKVWDEERHRDLTGAGNELVKENLRRLAALGKLAEVRVPVIPGYSDTVENMAAVARFVAKLDPAIPLRLQRFRTHGTIGVARHWPSPTDATMDRLLAVARSAGVAEVVRSR